MIETDLDDTHLCIKCSCTIVGLESYIQHRKHGCSNSSTSNDTTKIATSTSNVVSSHTENTIISSGPNRSNLDNNYDTFTFVEPEPPSSYATKAEHGDKSSKSLSDPYDLPYELGADVFFSSLQLQSVQSTGPSTSGGKTSSAQQQQQQQQLQRQKSNSVHVEVSWIENTASNSAQQTHSNEHDLMKAVSDISESKKPYDVIFKPISFVHESPEPSEEEEEEEADAEIDDEDDEDFDPIADAHATGGKWKPPVEMRHSPPVVPFTHTGGKWKPENRPNLRVTHTQLLTRLSPNWDEANEETEALLDAGDHPPADHTKGKWIPGTKLQRLEYKEEVELQKSLPHQNFWCNICCRKLKSKLIFENHLKTTYHLKRAEPERQLEKATLDDIDKNFVLEEPKVAISNTSKKRKRRRKFVKCELCKHNMSRHLLGKHLISHYHYRRMQLNPGKSFRMILDNIHSIVLQAPFQCRPCCFYTNTEETFLQHWNSPEHLDASEGPGKFWCSYCHFECEDNNQMRRHLLGAEHKEVIMAINRSVPICISKKISIDCPKCRQSFRYNLELRKHIEQCHPEAVNAGTASDSYQSRFICAQCSEVFRSKISLQRHEKHQHSLLKYFCSICQLDFDTPCKARRHRKTAGHRVKAASAEKRHALKSRLLLKKKSGQQVLRGLRECDKCNFVASTEVGAMLHELSHPSIEPSPNSTSAAVSQSCSVTITTRSQKDTISKCKDCEAIFTSLLELKEHRDVTHPLLAHSCPSCGESFALAQALGRHTRHCLPSTSKAAAQFLKTDNEVEPKDSVKIEETEKSWNCAECSYRASFESELIYHRLHHTMGPIGKNQLIDCPICSKAFRKQSLRCHLRQHTNEKIFSCDFCDMRFSRRHNLKNHISVLHMANETTKPTIEKMVESRDQVEQVNQTEEIQQVSNIVVEIAKVQEVVKKAKSGFQCDTCGKVYQKRYALKLHIVRSHDPTKKKRFACPVAGCLYAATTNTILKVHLYSHAAQSFPCARDGCTYVGKSALHLKRHSQSHLQTLPAQKHHKCDQCDFRTNISSHLKRHLRSHSGERPYKCPHCDFSCATLENLRKHILKTNKHPGKFIYECDLCKGEKKTQSETAADIFRTNAHQEYLEHLANSHKKSS